MMGGLQGRREGLFNINPEKHYPGHHASDVLGWMSVRTKTKLIEQDMIFNVQIQGDLTA